MSAATGDLRGELSLVRVPAADEATLARLDAWLRPDAGWSLADEYPLVFGPRSRATHHLLRDGDALVAHAATLDCEPLGATTPYPYRLVGSVVVAPDRRGRGLGRVLIDRIVDDFRRAAPRLLLLWSDQPGFYAGSGLAPVGEDRLLHLVARGVAPEDGVRPARRGDVDALCALHATLPWRLERRPGDFEDCLRVPAGKVFVLEDAGRVVAYAALGKGLDFAGTVHESAGDDESVARLVASLVEASGGALALLLPPDAGAVRGHLRPWTRLCEDRPLGLGLAKEPIPKGFTVAGFDSI